MLLACRRDIDLCTVMSWMYFHGNHRKMAQQTGKRYEMNKNRSSVGWEYAEECWRRRPLVKGAELQSKETTQEMLLNQLVIAKITDETICANLWRSQVSAFKSTWWFVSSHVVTGRAQPQAKGHWIAALLVNRLAMDFMKSTKAMSSAHPHPHSHPHSSLSRWLEAGQSG